MLGLPVECGQSSKMAAGTGSLPNFSFLKNIIRDQLVDVLESVSKLETNHEVELCYFSVMFYLYFFLRSNAELQSARYRATRLYFRFSLLTTFSILQT